MRRESSISIRFPFLAPLLRLLGRRKEDSASARFLIRWRDERREERNESLKEDRSGGRRSRGGVLRGPHPRSVVRLRKKPGRAACICILNTYPREPPNRPLPPRPTPYLLLLLLQTLLSGYSTFLSFWERNSSSSNGGKRIEFNIAMSRCEQATMDIEDKYEDFSDSFYSLFSFWITRAGIRILFVVIAVILSRNDCKRG